MSRVDVSGSQELDGVAAVKLQQRGRLGRKKVVREVSGQGVIDGRPNLARGYFFLIFAAIQFGMQPILTRLFIPAKANKTTLVLLCEVFKFIIGISMLLLEDPAKGRFILSQWKLSDAIIISGGAGSIYAVQNVTIQIGYQNLDSLSFNLLNQTKILFTAIMLYFVLGRRQSLTQCFALVMLLISGTLLCLKEKGEANNVDGLRPNSLYYGVLPALASAVMSGTASALSQKAMQGTGNRNAYLYTCELCGIGICVLVFGLIVRGETILDTSQLTMYSYIPIITNALGGVIIGQVIKHLGGVIYVFIMNFNFFF
eukprot:GSMAST32.ASY1.ANO1.2439.1 assembled CDS